MGCTGATNFEMDGVVETDPSVCAVFKRWALAVLIAGRF